MRTHYPAAASVLPHLFCRVSILIFVRFVLLLGALGAASAHAAGVQITSARVWPAADYTRVTFESQAPILHKFFSLDHPERLVLDLEDVDVGATLSGLAGKIGANDPYVQ